MPRRVADDTFGRAGGAGSVEDIGGVVARDRHTISGRALRDGVMPL